MTSFVDVMELKIEGDFPRIFVFVQDGRRESIFAKRGVY
jgi:hypothetical protein